MRTTDSPRTEFRPLPSRHGGALLFNSLDDNENAAAYTAPRDSVWIIHVTTTYFNLDPNSRNRDTGRVKTPIHCLKQVDSNPLWKIDDRIAPVDGELLIVKKSASGFHGTGLANYLTGIGVDTVLVAGVSASCCVPATIYDAKAHGFIPVAVKECVGDRIPAAVKYNLFDIGAKLGDVRSVKECVDYLGSI